MKHVKLIVVFTLIVAVYSARAQSTMMTEISYPVLTNLIQTAKDNTPHMKMINKQIGIAELNVKKAKLSWLDMVQFAYMKNNNVSASHTNSVLLNGYQYGINFNVGSLLQKPQQIKAANTELEIAHLEKEEYDRTLETTVMERYFNYIQHISILKLCMKAAQDAETYFKLIGSRFEKGEEKFDGYNEALNAYNLQLQKKIVAESQMLVAKAKLEEVVGKKLEELEYWQPDSVNSKTK